MAVTAYKFAGTAASVDRDGKGTWDTPDNAKADDTNYTIPLTGKNNYSSWLLLTNFGFSSSDIPSGATINGIEFVISRFDAGTADNSCDSALYLYDDGAVGNNLASATKWPTSEGTATYGGATDMCGTSLTQADIVATTFGVQLSHASGGSNPIARVNYIKIRVYYTAGGAGSLPTHLFQKPFRHMLIR